jgi:ABC-type phosphate/phosphonate transport system substrate-binding protein
MAIDLKLSYYPWLTQNVDPAEIRKQIERLTAIVASELTTIVGEPASVVVQRPLEVPEQIAKIVSGEHHIALMNPIGYVFARLRSQSVAPVAVAVRLIDGKPGITYFSQVYTQKKTAIKKLYTPGNAPTEKLSEADPKSIEAFKKQIFGTPITRSIGFGLPYSTSNFLVPAYDLTRAGVNPFSRFARTEFLKGHEIVAKAVYDGKVDLGAGHDGVIVDLSNQPGYGDAGERLFTLIRSDPIPSDPVAVNLVDQGLRSAVQRALVNAGKTDDGKEALKIFWGNTQGLDATDEKPYQGLNDVLGALGFREADLL